MNTAKINCPCCHSSAQSIILDEDFDGGWINCTECGKKMHISGSFAKESPEMIAKTIDELATCVAPYYAGGEK